MMCIHDPRPMSEYQQDDILLMQLVPNASMLDDQHIAWASDIEHQFGGVAPTNFNDDPSFRGGGTLNGTLRVSTPMYAMRPV